MNEEKELTFTINPKRLRYILSLYKISNNDFISQINKERKRNLLTDSDLEQIFNRKKKVDLSFLKRIDKIFEMGLTWYISDRELPEKQTSSIFFRKDSFNTELNLETRKKVNMFEELKFEIITLCNYINFKPDRNLVKYKITDNVKNVAKEIRDKFDEIENKLIQDKIIKRTNTPKEFLKNLIRIFEEFNIFVFEFVDRRVIEDKKTKFDGFFISPNIIVIKRQQDYLRREIFTLMHEFAHFLIDEEEIDVIIDNEQYDKTNNIERWCYNFSYYFLSGKHNSVIEKLQNASQSNNFLKRDIEQVYNNTFLSYSSIYTQLLIKNKISYDNYKQIVNSINSKITEKIRRKKEIQKIERERQKESGEKPFIGSSKPIISNLFKEIVEINFIQGNINRNDLKYYNKVFSSNIMSEVF